MSSRACKGICGQVSAARAAAVYVHVPFCAAKCPYCDFYSVVVEPARARRYIQALLAELPRRRKHLDLPAGSLFVGGGTPTVLEPDLLAQLLERLAELAGPETEFSVEANPGRVTPAVAQAIARAGANRVNLGAQSFVPAELRTLGRIHDPDQIAAAAEALRSAGIGNLGLDLIYGIPGQTLRSWRRSLEAALAIKPAHLSCYCLSFEPGTPLEADRQAGTVAEMPHRRQEACYRLAIQLARQAGLEHYEISNFARLGRQCRHNLTYWHNLPYLGLGAGATGYLAGVRRKTVADVEAYADAVLAGREPPGTAERLTGRALMAETLMLTLRLREGVDREAFRRRFGADPVAAFPASIARHEALGMLQVTPARLGLTEAALFVADTILADLLAEA